MRTYRERKEWFVAEFKEEIDALVADPKNLPGNPALIIHQNIKPRPYKTSDFTRKKFHCDLTCNSHEE